MKWPAGTLAVASCVRNGDERGPGLWGVEFNLAHYQATSEIVGRLLFGSWQTEQALGAHPRITGASRAMTTTSAMSTAPHTNYSISNRALQQAVALSACASVSIAVSHC